MIDKSNEPQGEQDALQNTIPPEGLDLLGEIFSFLIECDAEAQASDGSPAKVSSGEAR